jgi:hypothetical protein
MQTWEGSDFDGFEGCASDLIAAGLVRLDQLPGQPGRPTTSVTYDADGNQRVRPFRKPLSLHVRRMSTDRYIVYRHGVTEAEQQRRRDEIDASWKAEQEQKHERFRAEMKVRYMERTAEEYRERLELAANTFAGLLQQRAEGIDSGGFCVDKDTFEKLSGNLATMRAIVQAATVRFDPTYRPRRVAELLGPTRHLDHKFNRFMSGLSKGE